MRGKQLAALVLGTAVLVGGCQTGGRPGGGAGDAASPDDGRDDASTASDAMDVMDAMDVVDAAVDPWVELADDDGAEIVAAYNDHVATEQDLRHAMVIIVGVLGANADGHVPATVAVAVRDAQLALAAAYPSLASWPMAAARCVMGTFACGEADQCSQQFRPVLERLTVEAVGQAVMKLGGVISSAQTRALYEGMVASAEVGNELSSAATSFESDELTWVEAFGRSAAVVGGVAAAAAALGIALPAAATAAGVVSAIVLVATLGDDLQCAISNYRECATRTAEWCCGPSDPDGEGEQPPPPKTHCAICLPSEQWCDPGASCESIPGCGTGQENCLTCCKSFATAPDRPPNVGGPGTIFSYYCGHVWAVGSPRWQLAGNEWLCVNTDCGLVHTNCSVDTYCAR